MDDLDKSGERVVIIGVTSRPESIDQGLRRAGRFEREITIGVPSEEARVDILMKLTKGMRLRPDFPFQELVSWTPGYVGADMQTLCKEASIIAVERVIRELNQKKQLEVMEDPQDRDSDSSDEVDLANFFIEVADF